MKYNVAKTKEINPDIYSAEWEKAEVGYVNNESWRDEFDKAPETTFKMLRGPEGISILMHTDEKNLRCEVAEENGPICEDSCMEFFYKPSPWDIRYLNFEINPKGVLHLGIGKDRYGRIHIDVDREIFDIVSVAKEGDWTLKYYIPDTFINEWYNELDKLSGGNTSKIARGNFYKCGDKTDHPHLAAWSEVKVEKGDFHVPDFFGEFYF